MPITILMSKMIFIKYLPPARPKLVRKLKVPRICWKVMFNILIIRWFIDLPTERSIGYLRNYKFKGFLTIFLPKSNMLFCRWFELYGFFCSTFLRAPLIKMRDWLICSYERLDGSNYYPLCEFSFATKTAITLLSMQLDSSLRFETMSYLCYYKSQSSKLLNSCTAVVW